MESGEVWSQRFSYRTPSGPAEMVGSMDTTGTIIDFKTGAPIDHTLIAALVEILRSRISGPSIALQVL
jgi:hypothetical protein